MTRWLPFPLASASLLVLWLLLNQSLSAGHILVGAVLALVGPRMLTTLDLPRAKIRNPRAILRLSLLVLADIARSNVAVARIILNSNRRQTAGFMTIPLELRNSYALTALACIITATPGTIWVSFNPRTGVLLIHVLDLVDEDAWIRTIKYRYERLLLEIFE